MATISITIGAVSASRTVANDAKAAAALAEFYADAQMGPDTATQREKLQAIITWFVRHVQSRASLRYVQQQRAVAEAAAAGLFDVPVLP